MTGEGFRAARQFRCIESQDGSLVHVGYLNDTGTLTVSNGGTVVAGNRIILGEQSGATGTLNVGDGGAAGIIDAARIHGGSGTAILNFNHNDADYVFTDDGTADGAAVRITGSTAVNQIGTGTTVLTGSNTYTGGTRVNSGILRLSGAGTLGSSLSALTVNNGTLDLNGTSQSVGSLSGIGGSILLRDGALAVNQSSDTTYRGVISGTGSLTKAGSGTLTLTDANSHTGATTVAAGTLRLGTEFAGDDRLSRSTAVTLEDGATLSFGQTSQRAGSIAGDGTIEAAFIPATGVYGGTLTIGGDDSSTTFSGSLLVGTVNKTGREPRPCRARMPSARSASSTAPFGSVWADGPGSETPCRMSR